MFMRLSYELNEMEMEREREGEEERERKRSPFLIAIKKSTALSPHGGQWLKSISKQLVHSLICHDKLAKWFIFLVAVNDETKLSTECNQSKIWFCQYSFFFGVYGAPFNFSWHIHFILHTFISAHANVCIKCTRAHVCVCVCVYDIFPSQWSNFFFATIS